MPFASVVAMSWPSAYALNMKTVFLLFTLALGFYFWYDDMSNRRELESAKKQIEQLTQERDQAVKKLGKGAHVPGKSGPAQEENWFQKRLQEKSELDQSSSRGQSTGHH
jgi:hypothetical protein